MLGGVGGVGLTGNFRLTHGLKVGWWVRPPDGKGTARWLKWRGW